MQFDLIFFSFIFVLTPIIIAYKLEIGIEKELLKNSIRALLQLTILGFVLGFLFKVENYFLYIPVILFMLLYSAYIAKKRTDFSYKIAFITLTLSTIIILGGAVIFNIISLKPSEFIPIAGIIIGNSLNTYTITIERLKREINLQKELIEAFVSIGASHKDALKSMQKEAIKAALIPVNNTFQTIGIVSIPGITTGMLLAGANPLTAVSYQIAIIYILASINLFSALFGSIFFIKEKERGLI